VSWLYVWGGILTMLYAIWLFADFVADAVAGWLKGRIHHD
jgi:hypothetical protein